MGAVRLFAIETANKCLCVCVSDRSDCYKTLSPHLRQFIFIKSQTKKKFLMHPQLLNISTPDFLLYLVLIFLSNLIYALTLNINL